MPRRTTISDIAKQLRTTPATVSRALKDHPRISAETKQKVHALAEKLNFRINKVASSLRSGKTFVIGVMIPSAEINFFGSVVHGIESLANLEGYTILIYQTNERRNYEVKGLETFISARVDGILVSISKETEDYSHFEEIKNKGIPIVFFDRGNDELGISSVLIDDFRGAYLATVHLIEQGYRRIAHISGPLHMKIFLDRFNGYKKALNDHQLKFDKTLLVTGDISIEAGKNGIEELLKVKNPPDAVFAVEDFTALGALKELKNRGIKMPEQFGLVGFANELFGEHITPSLSTIDQQTVKMGKESFRLVLDLINQEDKPVKAKKIVLDPILILRESSQRS
jgi:LacI family transcriptional regulator